MKAGLIGAFIVLALVGFGIWGAMFYEPGSWFGDSDIIAPVAVSSPGMTTFDPEKTALLIHERVNAERSRAGVAPLAWNDDLALVAQAHSADMAERGYYDHVSPDGKDHRDRYADAGLNCFVRFDNGAIDNGSENLVSGPAAGSENQEAELAVSSWMGSTAGHRENMLRSQWASEGIGVAVGNGMIYVTQNFCN